MSHVGRSRFLEYQISFFSLFLPFFLFTILLFFYFPSPANAFDLKPKTKNERELEKVWFKTEVVKSVAPGVQTQAQLLVRYANIGDQVVPVGSMTVFEIQKKNIKAGSPDNINVRLGFLLGFDTWGKKKIGKGTYRYIGYDKKRGRLMQVLWKERKDSFLYAVAMVEEEALTPVSFEVELLQRKLSAESRSFAANDLFQLLIPTVEASSAPGPSSEDPNHNWGNKDEAQKLLDLISSEKEFEKFYSNMKTVQSAFAKTPQLAPASSNGFSEVSQAGFRQLFSFSPKELVEKTGVMAAGATVAPLAAATSIVFDKLDDLYAFLREAVTHEERDKAKVTAAEEAHKAYVPNSLANVAALDFRESLIKFKLALDDLGINQLSTDTIKNRIKVYGNFKKDNPNCYPDRIDTLVGMLNAILPYENNRTFLNLDICGSVRNLNVVILSYLRLKKEARKNYLTAIRPLLKRMAEKAKEGEKDVAEASGNAEDDFRYGAKLAKATFENVKKTYEKRKKERITACVDNEKRINNTNLKRAEEICLDYDTKDLIAEKELDNLREAEKLYKDAEQNFQITALLMSEGDVLENPLLDLSAFNELSGLTRKMVEETCIEPGGKCSVNRSNEAILKGLEFLNRQRMTEEKLKEACPELAK